MRAPRAFDVSSAARDRWLGRIPDEPRFVEARSLLLAGAPVEAVAPAGALVVDPGGDLAVLVGTSRADALRGAVSLTGLGNLIVQDEMHREAAAALPSWRIERAWLHTLVAGALEAWPEDPSHVRVLAAGALRADARDQQGASSRDGEPAGEPLAHVPGELVSELVRANVRSPLFCAERDDLLVSFAYAAHTTETLVDVSIDTLGPWRRRGLGADAARALVRWIVAGGGRPVWGALESNIASRRLAARLGFVPCGSLVVLSRRGP